MKMDMWLGRGETLTGRTFLTANIPWQWYITRPRLVYRIYKAVRKANKELGWK